MAKIVDSCCVPSSMAVQLTKPDKNNNTTANIDDGMMILPSEHCDVNEDGADDKSESTGDNEDRRHSSGGDDDGPSNNNDDNNAITTEGATIAPSSPKDEVNVPVNKESAANNANTSMNNANTQVPYKDFSGVDTESFITTTLRNNPKDRTLLLTLERLFQQFIQDDEQKSHQLQPMNSYERMIVHRVAAFFGLDHNVDKNGQAVVVTKTPNTRIPNFSFQKCIPEDESIDISSGASTSENPTSMTISTEIPARRILRRHEKHPNHEHSQRNGMNEEYVNQQTSSAAKAQPITKPYSERVNNYAETRARIFNETTDSSNTSTMSKNNRTSQKQHSNFIRPSYRKQQQQQQQQHQNSSQQHRSYTYQHSQSATNNHIQQYPTGKTIDPSSHVLNTSTNRTPSMYSTQQPPSANLSVPQPPPIYASIVGSNPGATPLRPTAATSFYTQPQQPPVDFDYKQATNGAHIYNYVSMIPSTASSFMHPQQQPTPQQLHPQPPPSSAATTGPNQVPSQHGAGIPLPILVQQPTGQIQYLFPAHHIPQQTQAPPPTNPYSLTPDGQYVQLYRPDALSMPGPPTVVDTNHTHHHPYSQTQNCHHHSISQQAQTQQQPQQQQVPPSQSTLAPQAPPFVRIFPTGTPGNASHPFAQGNYQPPPPSQTAFVQPGTISAPSFMIPSQTPGTVQTYPTFDNNIPYNTYGPTTGKPNVNNNGTSVQYATSHLSNLSIQNPHDDYQTRIINNQATRFSHSNGSATNNQQRNYMGRPLVQSPNGSTTTPRMNMYSAANQQYRQTRPVNISNTDKQIPSIENDPKSLSLAQQQNNCDNNMLAGPAQE